MSGTIPAGTHRTKMTEAARPRGTLLDDAPGARFIQTLVTFLEMTEPPTSPVAAPPFRSLEVRRMRCSTPSFYRYLYQAVGGPWTWTERLVLSDQERMTIIGDPAVEVNVLWAGGVPAGYAELDWRLRPDVELAYFGLAPEFIGQGLGRYLLDWSIRHAWRQCPRRLWVHTCDLDHPRALPAYQASGFRVYDRRVCRIPRPAGSLSPEHLPGRG
jgi:GNAT superfamily N-acetyltransferase